MEKKGTFIHAEGFFPSEKRWLFYRRFCNKKESKGDILGIHGLLEHSGRYEELGSRLVKKGYNFYMLDLTGHGRSEGPRGYINKIEDYLIDIANFYAFLKVHKNVQNPILFGHSLGGLLASIFSIWGKCPVKSLVLSAPLFEMKNPIPFMQRLLAKIISCFYSSYSLLGHIDPNLLSHDLDIVEDYITDPLVQNKINVKCLLKVSQAMKKIQILAPYIQIPCIVFHGEEDSLNDIEASKKFFYSLGTAQKELYIVRGAYHEIFNEKGKEELIDKLVDWLNIEK